MLIAQENTTNRSNNFNSISRRTVERAKVTCWGPHVGPSQASAIEADHRGARLLLPWQARQGEVISVSFGDSLGNYQTVRARVAWTHPMQWTNRVVAGLAFEEELSEVA